MPDLTPDEQRHAEELFDRVLELDSKARADFLDSCDATSAVIEEVKSLLAFHADAREKFDSPMVAPAAVVEAVDELQGVLGVLETGEEGEPVVVEEKEVEAPSGGDEEEEEAPAEEDE